MKDRSKEDEVADININTVNKYYGDVHVIKDVSLDIKKTNWANFLNLYNNKKNISKEEYNKEINTMIKKTNDKNLYKLLKFHLDL